MKPTRPAEWLIRTVVGHPVSDDLIGDLREEYGQFKEPESGKVGATLWFWRQSLSIALREVTARRNNQLGTHKKPTGNLMNSILSDLRFAVRGVAKNPAFFAIAIATLGLGIGANTAIFSVINGVLLSPLPYDNPDELVVIGGQYSGVGDNNDLVASGSEYIDLIDHATTVDSVAAGWTISINLTGVETPQRLEAALVTPNFLRTLGVSPILGRDFSHDDAQGDIGYVTLISYGAWQRFFALDPGVIGQTMTVDDDVFTIIGVMPRTFGHPGETNSAPVELWAPIDISTGTRWDFRNFRPLTVIGRLREGQTPVTAQAEFSQLAANLTEEYPASYPPESGWTLSVVPLMEHVVGDSKATLFILLSSVTFVLLITCTNVANLLLTKATERNREIGIRLALGGGKARIVRQLLTESMVLGLMGGAVGVALAAFGTDALRQLAVRDIPRIDNVSVNGPVLVFSFIVSVVSSVLFGLVPAVRLAGTNTAQVVKQQDRGSSGARSRLLDTLVVAQVALSIVLMASSGLMVKSFNRLLSVDPGFNPDGVLAMQTWLAIPNDFQAGRFATQELRTAFFDRSLQRLEELPGVLQAGLISHLPLRELNGAPFTVVGADDPSGSAAPTAEVRLASSNYAEIMGIPLQRGRFLSETDTPDAPPVVVINQALASRHFPDEDPIGRSIRLGLNPQAPPMEIVGVIGNVRQQALDVSPRPTVYVNRRQQVGFDMTFVLKTNSDPNRFSQRAVAAIQSADPDQPVFAVASMSDVVRESVAERRMLMLLVSLFAAQAAFLSAIGIYGVIAYVVRQRTREIGIRIALGAERANVLQMVLGYGLKLGLAGVVIGLVGAVAFARTLSASLYEVGASDPTTLVLVAAGSGVIAVAASLLPANRASKVDPVVTMKAE